MLKECILSKTGIRFNPEYLETQVKFSFRELEEERTKRGLERADLGDTYIDLEPYLTKPNLLKDEESRQRSYLRDACDNTFDQLVISPLWWCLELLPAFFSFQDEEGNWIRFEL
jgi:hypothetical protein